MTMELTPEPVPAMSHNVICPGIPFEWAVYSADAMRSGVAAK